jgi:hypothetical protein
MRVNSPTSATVSASRGGSGRKVASQSEHSEPQLGYVA